MKVSRREAILLVSFCAAALYGGSAFLARAKIDEWKDLRREQEATSAQIEMDQRLIEQKAEWERQFAELKDLLPQFPDDAKMDIHWMEKMDLLASKNNVQIKSRQAKDEERAGDLFELPIECRHWESSLDGFVHFLFDLQSEGAMLDILELYIKPLDDKSLRGRFLLNCAYTKSGGGVTNAAPVAEPAAATAVPPVPPAETL